VRRIAEAEEAEREWEKKCRSAKDEDEVRHCINRITYGRVVREKWEWELGEIAEQYRALRQKCCENCGISLPAMAELPPPPRYDPDVKAILYALGDKLQKDAQSYKDARDPLPLIYEIQKACRYFFTNSGIPVSLGPVEVPVELICNNLPFYPWDVLVFIAEKLGGLLIVADSKEWNETRGSNKPFLF
jgi:hypothetical protein